jgi:hypothetical protein
MADELAKLTAPGAPPAADDGNFLWNLLKYGLRGKPKTSEENYQDANVTLAKGAGVPVWQGPPMAGQPWDNWDAKKHEEARKLLAEYEGAMSYQNGGGMGVGMKYKGLRDDTLAAGGLPPELAQTMARYRIMEHGLGPVPTGERKAPSVELDGSEYLSNEGFFDALTHKPELTTSELPAIKLTTKKAK